MDARPPSRHPRGHHGGQRVRGGKAVPCHGFRGHRLVHTEYIAFDGVQHSAVMRRTMGCSSFGLVQHQCGCWGAESGKRRTQALQLLASATGWRGQLKFMCLLMKRLCGRIGAGTWSPGEAATTRSRRQSQLHQWSGTGGERMATNHHG